MNRFAIKTCLATIVNYGKPIVKQNHRYTYAIEPVFVFSTLLTLKYVFSMYC